MDIKPPGQNKSFFVQLVFSPFFNSSNHSTGTKSVNKVEHVVMFYASCKLVANLLNRWQSNGIKFHKISYNIAAMCERGKVFCIGVALKLRTVPDGAKFKLNIKCEYR